MVDKICAHSIRYSLLILRAYIGNIIRCKKGFQETDISNVLELFLFDGKINGKMTYLKYQF